MSMEEQFKGYLEKGKEYAKTYWWVLAAGLGYFLWEKFGKGKGWK